MVRAADMPSPEVSCTSALRCLLRCTPVHGNANDVLPRNGPLPNITTRAQCLQHAHSVYNLCTVSAACAQYLQQVHRVYQHVHTVYNEFTAVTNVHIVYPLSAQRLWIMAVGIMAVGAGFGGKRFQDIVFFEMSWPFSFLSTSFPKRP